MKLPPHLRKYFWDTDFDKIDLERSRVYVLKRILEYGDEQAVRWMWDHFGPNEIRTALSKYRGFSRKTANFWALIVGIPRDQILCLKKPSSETPRAHWPY